MVDEATPGTHELPQMVAVATSGTTDSTGGDTAHNNIQPSYVVNKIVRLK
jgi:microcystin-dependent protein